MTAVFDSDDINYLISHFNIDQLRVQKNNAEKKAALAFTEHDREKENFYKDFAECAKLAIAILQSNQPKIKSKFNIKYESIEYIKSRYDLVDYIGQYTRLRKTGNKFMGMCPLHADKRTASFVIYPNNTWHCFGACNSGGSIIDFVMKYENLDLKATLSKLSR